MPSGLNPENSPVPHRERVRARTLAEIRDAARRQIEAGGAGALSLKALAQELGMAGPSLYRYVRSRDELLTDLLVEAYGDLADAVEAVAGPADPAERVRGFARAYRAWARARPGAYDLLFGTPVPGYAAPPEVTTPVARRALAVLAAAVAELTGDGPGSLTAATRIWARLHGLVDLELGGHLAPLGTSVDGLVAAEIEDSIAMIVSGRPGPDRLR